MNLLWILAVSAHYFQIGVYGRTVNWEAPWIEKEYDPTRYANDPPREHLGYPLPLPHESPDFRLDEPVNKLMKPFFFKEEYRPYRLSPSYKTTYLYDYYNPYESIMETQCYCTTVFKRLTPLAGCAVITTRHVLTTATSTHLVLRDRLHYKIMDNILGVWYDTNHDNFNSSMYLTPARIHYHPDWHYPERVNRSHPFSFSNDLAVWATTYTIYGWYFMGNSAKVCQRATSHPRWQGKPNPNRGWEYLIYIIVGFQYMLAYERKPMPWFKHGIRVWRWTEPCPKTEWGWFICIPLPELKFGVESGACLHRTDKGTTWKYDGLIAMAAFSMKLRSAELTHYFTILDCYPMLDFLYDAYEGALPYVWLDKRFEDTKHRAPRLKWNYYIYRDYRIGSQHPYQPIYESR